MLWAPKVNGEADGARGAAPKPADDMEPKDVADGIPNEDCVDLGVKSPKAGAAEGPEGVDAGAPKVNGSVGLAPVVPKDPKAGAAGEAAAGCEAFPKLNNDLGASAGVAAIVEDATAGAPNPNIGPAVGAEVVGVAAGAPTASRNES